MNALQSWAVVYLVNSLWQIPLIFAAAWIAARLLRPVSPDAEHCIWVCALLAQVTLPACQFDGNAIGHNIWAYLIAALARPESGGRVQVIVNPGAAADSAMLHIPTVLLNGTLVLYAVTVLYFALRLCLGYWKTHVMLRDSEPVKVVHEANLLRSLAGRFMKHGEAVHFAMSATTTGPVTLGARRGVVLFPIGFIRGLAASDLELVLAHELAHVQRRDFAKNLLYSFVSLPIAYHPLLWLTASNLAATREMVCDAMAADSVTARECYAQSLLRLAAMLSDRMPVRTLHAIGIFDANVFERRIMRLTQIRKKVGATKRMAAITIVLVLGLATCASAIALGIRISPDAASISGAGDGKTVHVNQNNMKIASRVNPIYPTDAKKAGIQGTVVLQAVINKEGVPEQLKVISGPKELQASSLDAVRQWRWEPYRLNGDPVEVDTEIKVTFSLKG